jgi:ribonuclease HII
MEQILKAAGTKIIAGVDEAGRGAWAGPVVAAAVILPDGSVDFGINDSKLLTPSKREEVYQKILEHAIAVGVGVVEVTAIDKFGLARATYLAMSRAIDGLKIRPEFILVDGYKVNFSQAPSGGMIDGDARCLPIAAASVIAKVTRDRLMLDLHQQNPRFGFAVHKGYGTALHRERLITYGVSSAHRRSFAPIAQLIRHKKVTQAVLE